MLHSEDFGSVVLLHIYVNASNIEVQKSFNQLHDQNIHYVPLTFYVTPWEAELEENESFYSIRIETASQSGVSCGICKIIKRSRLLQYIIIVCGFGDQ